MFCNAFSRNTNLRPIRSRAALQIEALEERSLLCCCCFGLPLVAPVSAAPPVSQVGVADTMIDLHSDESAPMPATPAQGSEFRAPDIYRVSVGVSTPIPFVSGSAEIAMDRHGQVYFTPGAGAGLSTPISASFTGEWLDQPTTPTREQTSGYATGPGGNAMFSAWPTMPGLVAGKSAVPGAGTATVVGVSTPQYGVNAGYGIKLLDPAEARSFTIDPADSRAGLPGYKSNGFSDFAYPEDALTRSALGLPVADTDVWSTIFGQGGE